MNTPATAAQARTAIIVGASSGLGRALASELARCGNTLLLVASDARDLQAVAADLRLRSKAEVTTLALDLARDGDPGARIAAVLAGLPSPSALLLVAGLSCADDDFSLPAPRIGELLAINLHAPLAIVHGLLPALREAKGTIVLFGSIAATRGRGRNVVYASAKRALDSLYESLRQSSAPGAPWVQLYRLGFIASNLTWGMRLPLAASPPGQLAPGIVARLGKGSFARHLPLRYAWLAAIMRTLPWALYRRWRG